LGWAKANVNVNVKINFNFNFNFNFNVLTTGSTGGTGKTFAGEYQYAVHEILNHQGREVSRRTDHEGVGFSACPSFVYLGGLGG
jgi:hypothetical protein